MSRLEIRKLKKVSRIEIGDRPITIGRSTNNDVVLRDERISRRHCVIEVVKGLPRVRDLGSHTGTFVNGLRIKESPLSHRDRVSIGPFDLVYRDAESEFAIHSDSSLSTDASAIGADSSTAGQSAVGDSNAEMATTDQTQHDQAQHEHAQQLLAAQTQQIAELTAAAAALHSEIESKSGQITTLRSEMESLIQRQRNTEATRQTALDRISRTEDQIKYLHQRIDAVNDAVTELASIQRRIAQAEQEWTDANERCEFAADDAAAADRRTALSAQLDALNREREDAIALLERNVQHLRAISGTVQSRRTDSEVLPANAARSKANTASLRRWWRFGAGRHA